jgi:aspartate 1-decarboxylase
LNYVGSITIDETLLEAAGLLEGQVVQVTNLSNGVLWRTYILKGKRGKGEIVLNGPPAHHFKRGDIVIIWADAWMEKSDAEKTSPTTVFMDEKNKITKIKKGWRPS